MNWGHGIIVGYVLFVAYILYFVFTSVSHDIELVAEDYYAKEVAYQDHIDASQNANKWGDAISVKHDHSGIHLTFADSAKVDFISGTVLFFRPSDAKLDIRLPITLDEEGKWTIPNEVLRSGQYELQMNWTGQGGDYFIKQRLTI